MAVRRHRGTQDGKVAMTRTLFEAKNRNWQDAKHTRAEEQPSDKLIADSDTCVVQQLRHGLSQMVFLPRHTDRMMRLVT